MTDGFGPTRGLAALGPLSIPAKLVLLVAVIIGAIATFFFYFVPAQLEQQAVTALTGKARSIGIMAAYSVRSAVVFEDDEGMRDALAGAMGNEAVLYAAVTTPDGVVITFLETEGTNTYDADGETEDGDASAVHRVSTPVEWEGETIAFVALGMRTTGLRQQVLHARQVAAVVSFLVFLLGTFAVLMGSRVVTRPLHDMVETAQRISEGDLFERAEIGSRDEVGRLAEVFNEMVSRLQIAQMELEGEKRDLEGRVEKHTRQLMDSEQLLRQAQKMEAVGRLAAGVAHDFNNLLTVINGHAELVALILDADDPNRESIESISIAGASAAALTQQLLAFSRKQVLQPVDLNVNDVVGKMLKILGGLLGETVKLSLELSPDVVPIRADPGQVQQVIMNLAVNSKDAMKAGGELSIRTRNVRLGAQEHVDQEGTARGNYPEIQFDEELAPGDYVEIQVADDGHGMPDEVKAIAFEPFFSTKAAGKGTGLGLSTVDGIVSQSGGHLRLESEAGKGTTFFIYFPRIVVGAEHHEVDYASRGYDRGSERILLVEDADQVRLLASRMLTGEGYEITEADCGEAALERLAANDGAFDLILTDIVMPNMNGRELAERVSTLYPGMLIVYMSGYTDDEVMLSGIRDRDVAFLEKPFTRDRLLGTVRSALDSAGLTV